MKYFILFAILSLAIAGCRSLTPSSPTLTSSTELVRSQRSPISDFQEQAAHNGSITFRSWNGKWIGFDGDTDLRFLPDGRVEMIEYGVGVTVYSGRYQIGGTATLSVEFKDFDHPWPAMLLERDDKSLLLQRADGSNAFIMGNRMGATFSGGGTYWPFRAIPAGKCGGARGDDSGDVAQIDKCLAGLVDRTKFENSGYIVEASFFRLCVFGA
jgi:hypothetical protein